jgi:tetratricopeptide (TPR) repeat protein
MSRRPDRLDAAPLDGSSEEITPMMKRLMFAAALSCAVALATTIGSATQAPQPGQGPRFDEIVRADFFAGIAGDAAALDRAMRLIEKALADDPRRADVLVWHGSGLVVRSGQAFEKGDFATGATLWERGLKEMNDAVALAPENVAVLIPRGAVLLEASRSLPDPVDAMTVLSTGVSDYEKVLQLQAPYFRYLSDHSRGELLFGLAEGLHRLGQRDRARVYFERLLSETKNSEYGKMADAWLKDPSGATARQRGCVGCHKK